MAAVRSLKMAGATSVLRPQRIGGIVRFPSLERGTCQTTDGSISIAPRKRQTPQCLVSFIPL